MASVINATEAILNPVLVKSNVVPKTINASLLSCAPVTIVNEALATIATVASGGTYEVQNVDILDQDSNVIAEVAPGGTYSVLLFSGIDGGTPSTTFTNSIVGGTP